MSKKLDTASAALFFASFPLSGINEELVARGLSPCDSPTNGAQMLALGCRSIDDFAVTTVNLSRGEVKGGAMTQAMVLAFPDHNIGERHGPHYTSLARTGETKSKIACRYHVPKGQGRKAKAGAVTERIVEVQVERTYDLSSLDEAKLKALAKAVKGTPLEALLAKSLRGEVTPIEPAMSEPTAPAAE